MSHKAVPAIVTVCFRRWCYETWQLRTSLATAWSDSFVKVGEWCGWCYCGLCCSVCGGTEPAIFCHLCVKLRCCCSRCSSHTLRRCGSCGRFSPIFHTAVKERCSLSSVQCWISLNAFRHCGIWGGEMEGFCSACGCGRGGSPPAEALSLLSDPCASTFWVSVFFIQSSWSFGSRLVSLESVGLVR